MAQPVSDELPLQGSYNEQYDEQQKAAIERYYEGEYAKERPGELPLVQVPPATKEAEPVPVPGEAALPLEAESAAKIPPIREQLQEATKSPGVRDALNSLLNTVTGGTFNLDLLNQHFEAQVKGEESPLTSVLQSPEALKLLDPAGNTMDAIVREQGRREGWSPERIDQVAGAAGLLAGALAPTPGAGTRTGKTAAVAGTRLFMNSLFSNPTTHAAILASGALTSAWAVPERLFAASWAAAEYAATLGKHERKVFFGETGAQLFGALQSSMDAIVAMGHTLRTGEVPKVSIGRDLARGGLTLGKPLAQKDRDLISEGIMQQGNNFFSTVSSLPTRFIVAEHRGVRVANYRMEEYAQLYRKAAAQGDISVKNLRKEFNKPNKMIRREAEEWATAQTFQTNIDELGPTFRAAGRMLGAAQDVHLGAIPLGRIAVPVLRTPMNMVHFGLERTPLLNALSSTWRADVAAGGARRALAMGKLSGGAVLATTAVNLAHVGAITGDGPADPKLKRYMMELQGWRPNSLKIGDTYYSLDRLGPVGHLLTTAASIAEIGGSMPQERLNKIGQAFGLATSRYMSSATFLQTYAEVIAAYQGDQKALGRLVAQGLIGELTPGALRAAKRFWDPVQREWNPGADPNRNAFSEVRGLITEVRRDIPGWSNTAPAHRNLWGDSVMLPSGFGQGWINPVYSSTEKHDPASDEIVRLGKKGLPIPGMPGRSVLGRDSDAGPVDQPQNPFNFGVGLTDWEYDEYVRLAGNELKGPNGLGYHDALNEMVKSDRYKNASDAKKSLMIMMETNAYRRAATAQFLKNNPAVLETYKQRKNAMGAAVAASPRAMTNPHLMIGGAGQ